MNSVHAVFSGMLAQGNVDILICSSISGRRAIHWEPVYSASKHAPASVNGHSIGFASGAKNRELCELFSRRVCARTS
jgi:hypothetical protein